MRTRREAGAATVGGLLFVAAAFRLDAGAAELARLVILGSALGMVAAIDFAQHRIPNRVVIPASVGCAGLLAADGGQPAQLLPGLGVVALMLAISLARPASLGMGDVKLGLLLVLGLAGLAAQAIVLGLVLAATFGVLLLVWHGGAAGQRALPLAPFLGSGAVMAVML